MLTATVPPVRTVPSICICDDATFLPWRTWREIASWPDRAGIVAVVPVAGMADHGAEMPLDAEEQVLMRVLKEASLRRGGARMQVTPPLRFVAGPAAECAFAVEPPVAHAFIDDVCASLAASGFRKIVLCNASPWNEGLCDAAARDIRIARGLQMFCVNLSALRLDFSAPADRERIMDVLVERAELARAGRHLARLLQEIAARPPLAGGGVLKIKT